MKNNILFILIIMLIFTSCRKDDISDGVITQPPAPLIIYKTDVIGSVVDQNGNALANVQISSGQNFVETDVNGLFKIDGLTVDGIQGAYIAADADGYFSGGDRFYTRGTHKRQIEITLVEKELSGYVNANKNETISLQSGLQIDFPANGFTLNGNDYNGLVLIYAYHLDPSQEGYLSRSPGDLSGTDELNNSYVLESFGMIAVDMETADGLPLQLKEGSLSTITVPVDASLLSDAPIELPLWHFDDELHKWVKEGMAELVDGAYVGKVPHFSWWNCDDFLESAFLCIQLLDPRYIGSLPGFIVELTSESQGTSTGVSDTEGYVNGVIPANETIEITVYDVCGNVIYSGTIGPFTGTDNKEVIPIVIVDLDLYEFSGTVFDCESMEFLANGIVKIQIAQNIYYTETNENGVYNYSAFACDENEEYSVTAYNAVDGTSGYATGTTALNEVNIVDINLCNETPFIIINGELVGEDVTAIRKPNETIISSYASSSAAIGFYGFTIGTFPAFFSNGGNQNSVNSTVTITQYDNLGGIIKGTIEGVDDSSGANFTGSFVAIVVE